MGRGGGALCSTPSKTKDDVPPQQTKPNPPPPPSTAVQDKPVTGTPVNPQPTAAAPAQVTAPMATLATGKPVRIFIVFYSTYGHLYKLAQAQKEGVDSIEGCEGILYQVPETLPAEVLAKIGAPPKPDVPIIDPHELPNADGFLFGFPTRYGMMAAQFKAFLDATGQLWQKGSLVGKPVGFFVGTASQGGGQETTIMTAVTQAVHHGMIFVPPGYSFGGPQFDLEEVRGGSPWGAGTFAGPTGARQPSKDELAYATHQGAYLAKKAKLLSA